MLAYEGPGLDEDDPLAGWFALADMCFLFIFVSECLLRICHKGFLFTNVACKWSCAPPPRSNL